MKIDLLVSDLKPNTDDLFPQDEQQRVFDSSIKPEIAKIRRPSRRPWIAVAAVAAAALLITPVALPKTATALEPVARVAEARTDAGIPTGKWLHIVSKDTAKGTFPKSSGDKNGNWCDHESWVDSSSWTWRIAKCGSPKGAENADWSGKRVFMSFPPYSHSKATDMPKDVKAVDAWIRAQHGAAENKDAAVFQDLSELLRDHMLTADQRALTIRTIGQLPGVTVNEGKDTTGRDVTVAAFKAQHPNGRWTIQSLTFDSKAELVGESLEDSDGKNQSVVAKYELVNKLPDEVVKALGTGHKEQWPN